MKQVPWQVTMVSAFLLVAMLACEPATVDGTPAVSIITPTDGMAVTVGERVSIQSMATAGAGVACVELSVNGRTVRTDAPPTDNPTTFSITQPWMPETAGDAAVMVVVYDTRGAASSPAVLKLQVAGSESGPAPTTTPQATAKPVDDVEGEGGCTLNAGYVTDVTIPDNTVLNPGTSFVKTWRIRNTGTCDWESGFRLVFLDGDQMSGPGSIAVNATAAGNTMDVSLNLVAPTSPGTYRGNWRMQSGTGAFFGSTFYVQIVVPAEEPTEEAPVSPPTNLRVEARDDDKYSFTWDDATGEIKYHYAYSHARNAGGSATKGGSLPANTTSWTTPSAVECGVEGSFIIAAEAKDGTEIGSETVNFETDPCALPDLVVIAQVNPIAIPVGGSVNVEVTVMNIGDGAAEGPFEVFWTCGDSEDLTCRRPVRRLGLTNKLSDTFSIRSGFGIVDKNKPRRKLVHKPSPGSLYPIPTRPPSLPVARARSRRRGCNSHRHWKAASVPASGNEPAAGS